MIRKSLGILLAAAGLALVTRPLGAEPIYIQMDGVITSISSPLTDTFDQASGFSLIFGWDPARARPIPPSTSSYLTPFSVAGTIGGQYVAFETEDYTRLYPESGVAYFELDRTLSVDPRRYGPNGDWGVRAFTLFLDGWDTSLSSFPTYGSANLHGNLALYINEVGSNNFLLQDVGGLHGTTTAVSAIPEPSSALVLLLGVCAVANHRGRHTLSIARQLFR